MTTWPSEDSIRSAAVASPTKNAAGAAQQMIPRTKSRNLFIGVI
jgi:hypothetical protein